MHVAAFKGRDIIAGLLVAAGASGHSEYDDMGRTAVHLAALAGHADVVSAMGEQGAPLNVRDATDTSALQHAVSASHMLVASMLVSHGVDPDDYNKDGWSGLHIAAAAGNAEYTKQWITMGCDCNKPTSADSALRTRGYTPLLLASQAPPGAAEATIAVLLEHKADPGFTDLQEGKTALQLALDVDSMAVADCLVRAGASFESERANGSVDDATAERFSRLREEHVAEMQRNSAYA